MSQTPMNAPIAVPNNMIQKALHASIAVANYRARRQGRNPSTGARIIRHSITARYDTGNDVGHEIPKEPH